MITRPPKVYTAPIRILDPTSVRYQDEELLLAFDEYPPKTKFKPGDLAIIQDVPEYLALRCTDIPNIWQIRFVISTWMFELMRLVHSDDPVGIDHAVCLLEERFGLTPERYFRPVIYAHGFPHGLNPDSATWFPERALRRIALRSSNEDWPVILDAARAPLLGYDESRMIAPYNFDVAPDLYANGESLGRPFHFEEAAVHSAALLGLEEALMTKSPCGSGHDINTEGGDEIDEILADEDYC